ncbi:unnamed protein product (macronuclear) [Paramecium tetraurelia]|uniref:Uncharacterized protein n=1 Tax=Paramecium tetraurelia TaxID=5888 RepID=A0EC25_PARTE|nr:uncharacterized protein GSPATT00025578001 [Paramecium tetraurelia]CAK92842.1 unnamed protein product [Paramecium tetraurelia]|eukprot:XP_001460239.1 hypothetical protein (macronuclear) [Paramecium tetraurelia strain d4-2]
MGSTSSCFKHQQVNQNEFQIPMIVKQQLIQQCPTKQNFLIQPIYGLGEKSESIEELEAILQQPQANFNFNQTATFHSNSNFQDSQKGKQPLLNQQESQCKQSVNKKDNQNQIQCLHSTEENHQPQDKNKGKLNCSTQKRKSFSRSLSNFKQQKCEWKDDCSQKQKDSDQNTIKSILKKKSANKNQKQLLYKRGQSLKQKSNFVEVDDTESQNTNKMQKKKVKFDPKIFRQKNTHFFQ